MTWPPVFDGIGALVVNCALDPDALADKIPGVTWIAYKVGGTDVAPLKETQHCYDRWTARGLLVGAWCYCPGPPDEDVAILDGWPLPVPFVIYDVEVGYKADEGGHYEYAAELVNEQERSRGAMPVAVTSYGGYKTSIDFGSFAKAGWPIFAQVYDAFKPGDELTYVLAPYPGNGIHQLTRSLTLSHGQAVYRPESIDG